jgi:hypothetical protein
VFIPGTPRTISCRGCERRELSLALAFSVRRLLEIVVIRLEARWISGIVGLRSRGSLLRWMRHESWRSLKRDADYASPSPHSGCLLAGLGTRAGNNCWFAVGTWRQNVSWDSRDRAMGNARLHASSSCGRNGQKWVAGGMTNDAFRPVPGQARTQGGRAAEKKGLNLRFEHARPQYLRCRGTATSETDGLPTVGQSRSGAGWGATRARVQRRATFQRARGCSPER